MNDCGHASGITYAGCMKCDLDKLKERNAELQATIERVRGLPCYSHTVCIGNDQDAPPIGTGEWMRKQDVLEALKDSGGG